MLRSTRIIPIIIVPSNFLSSNTFRTRLPARRTARRAPGAHRVRPGEALLGCRRSRSPRSLPSPSSTAGSRCVAGTAPCAATPRSRGQGTRPGDGLGYLTADDASRCATCCSPPSGSRSIPRPNASTWCCPTAARRSCATANSTGSRLPHAACTDWLRDAVRSGQGTALHDSTLRHSPQMVQLRLRRPSPLPRNLDRNPTVPAPRLTLSPL